MKLIWLFVPILIATSCPRHQKIQTDPVPMPESSEKESVRFRELIQTETNKKKQVIKDEQMILSEALFSAAMIESEIFKLIRPEFEQRTTPFQVISAAFDIAAGRPAKFKLSDCKLWKTKKINESRVEYIQNCVAPGFDFFSIEKKSKESWKIVLKSSHWGAYLGPAVALTAADRDCFLQTQEGRIQLFECQNTVFGHQPENTATAVYELRLSQFQIRVEAQNQVEIAGGFFKDLVEYRKISMVVPKEGKIKITEKALKVRDDFAHLLKEKSAPAAEVPAASLDHSQNISSKESQVQDENQNEKKHEENFEKNSNEKNNSENSFETQPNQEDNPQGHWQDQPEKIQEHEENNSHPEKSQPVRQGR